jgi:hypothetical protein
MNCPWHRYLPVALLQRLLEQEADAWDRLMCLTRHVVTGTFRVMDPLACDHFFALSWE